MKIAEKFEKPNLDLYRTINELRMDGKWNEVISICKEDLERNKDIFVLARLLEGLCIQFGVFGFQKSIEILSDIDFNIPNMNPSEITRIFLWLKNSLWQAVFQHKDLNSLSNKTYILRSMLDAIPAKLSEFQDPILTYIKSQEEFEFHEYIEDSRKVVQSN